jgi:hypothetical protein
MRTRRQVSDEQKVEDLNTVLALLREHVGESGSATFSMQGFIRESCTGLKMDRFRAVPILINLGFVRNLGSAGNQGSLWQIDMSERTVVMEDVQPPGGSKLSNQILKRQLQSERSRVRSLEQLLRAKNIEIETLKKQLETARRDELDKILSSLVLFLEEQQDPQN